MPALAPVHTAQVLAYLKVWDQDSGALTLSWRLGVLAIPFLQV